MSHYLLIHGAWHGAWCWEPLMQRLRTAGHRVTAFDLPGAGDDYTPVAEVTLQSWIDRTVQVLEQCSEPVVLVGHSMGGMVIAGVAGARPDKIAALVYLCAFMPQVGESLFDLATRPEGASTLAVQQATADGLCTTVPADNARVTFYGHCAPAVTDAAVARLRPLPLATVMAALPAPLAEPRELRRVYVECTEDCAIPIALQRYMWGRDPAIEVRTLVSDHSPFASQPDTLAALLGGL